jgi:hypothetical protein
LANFCSFSQAAISQNQLDLENNDFVTIYLLHQSQVQSEVDGTIDLSQKVLTTRMNSFLNYLRITTRANYLVSSLNTNFLVQALTNNDYIYIVGGMVVYGSWSETGEDISSYTSCSTGNPTSSTSLLSDSNPDTEYVTKRLRWEEPPPNFLLVNGFFAACTPLEALLQSTLDCLYNINCLQLLSDDFSHLNQVGMMPLYFIFLSRLRCLDQIQLSRFCPSFTKLKCIC